MYDVDAREALIIHPLPERYTCEKQSAQWMWMSAQMDHLALDFIPIARTLQSVSTQFQRIVCHALWRELEERVEHTCSWHPQATKSDTIEPLEAYHQRLAKRICLVENKTTKNHRTLEVPRDKIKSQPITKCHESLTSQSLNDTNQSLISH